MSTCTAMTPSEAEEFNKLGIRNAKLYNALKEFEQIVKMAANKTYIPPHFAQAALDANRKLV